MGRAGGRLRRGRATRGGLDRRTVVDDFGRVSEIIEKFSDALVTKRLDELLALRVLLLLPNGTIRRNPAVHADHVNRMRCLDWSADRSNRNRERRTDDR